ncbi:MAG: arsenate reductase (glutaredoxin) [Acidimicrobiales bacterium]
MDPLIAYHNPACSKSRGALDILAERGVEVEVVPYLDRPPDRAQLERMLDLLGGPPERLVRKDGRFEALGLRPEDYTERRAVVDLLLAHPELMERPVVMRGDRAVIARPSEIVLELFDD